MNYPLAIAIVVVFCVLYVINDRKKVKKQDEVSACKSRLDALESEVKTLKQGIDNIVDSINGEV